LSTNDGEHCFCSGLSSPTEEQAFPNVSLGELSIGKTLPVAQFSMRAGVRPIDTVTSKERLSPWFKRPPGISQYMDAAGTGVHSHSGPSGVTVSIFAAAPLATKSATSSTLTRPAGAAVPLLVTVIVQSAFVSRDVSLHSLSMARSGEP
jgi:hypothetical protein